MPRSMESVRQPQRDVVAVADEVPQTVASAAVTICPSFDDEPWKSRADEYRPSHFTDKSFIDLTQSYPPLPSQHPYVKLLLEFLDTVPKECWIDEENEED